jgi:hypothetical protein
MGIRVHSNTCSVLVNWSSPKIQDWWASWSQRRLKKKIHGLERELGNPITADDIIIYGLKGVLHTLLNLFAFLIAWFTPDTFHLPGVLSSGPNSPSANETELLVWLRIYVWAVTILMGWWYYTRLFLKHLHWKYPALYQPKVEQRIINLKAELK